MKIRVAILSTVVVSSLWLLPMTAVAKDERKTITPTPHQKCLDACEVGFNKCKVEVGTNACSTERARCRDVLCATSPTK
jgi:hypothetical protein